MLSRDARATRGLLVLCFPSCFEPPAARAKPTLRLVMTQYRYSLSERDIPKTWYNVIPDLPAPLPPPLHPGTGAPVGPQDLAPIFPMALIQQEVSPAPAIAIPDPVLDVLRLL